MAWEDAFLRLDPYNFDTEEEYLEFLEESETIEDIKNKRKGLNYERRIEHNL